MKRYYCLNKQQEALVRRRFVLRFRRFTGALRGLHLAAFTLVEMLMALLIISVILSASLPVISQRTKAQSQNYSKYSPMPIGAIIMWKVDGALPDNTWLEANGQAIPNGIEYEQCRKVYGSRLPDLRGADNEFYTNLNNYLSKDIKNYLQTAIKPLPKDGIIIWGSTANIPEGWSEATEYRGVFLRGYGTITHTQNNGSTIGNTATNHSSGAIGSVQGDTIRNISGGTSMETLYLGGSQANTPFIFYWGGSSGWDHGYTGSAGWQASMGFDASKVTPTSNEIRPINKAVRYIKYSNSPALPDMPETPQYSQKFRYIVKVRN